MATLPYVTSPGNVDKALLGIKSAAVPAKVSQDFVKTILKISGGSGSQMTFYLKKLGFAGPDGSPSELYKKFRNPTSSGAAIAQAIRLAYQPLYIRNEFMHELSDKELAGLVTEETGQAHDSNPVKLIVACIKRLKAFADFNREPAEAVSAPAIVPVPVGNVGDGSPSPGGGGIGLNLGYTINLNLPATADPAVFDAIFKSLKEHLLRPDDA
jgi:hypothetical protein